MLMVFKRVADWNAARYEQEFNLELMLNLLHEELKEYFEADAPVDELDALCDLAYLVMGGLWKLGIDLSPEGAVQAVRVIEAVMEHGVILHPMSLVYPILVEAEADPESALYKILGVVQLMMLHMGLNQTQCEGAMHIVCDSNDTKPAKKTASDVKANIDKGSSFVAPEPRLQKLLDSIIPEVTH